MSAEINSKENQNQATYSINQPWSMFLLSEAVG